MLIVLWSVKEGSIDLNDLRYSGLHMLPYTFSHISLSKYFQMEGQQGPKAYPLSRTYSLHHYAKPMRLYQPSNQHVWSSAVQCLLAAGTMCPQDSTRVNPEGTLLSKIATTAALQWRIAMRSSKDGLSGWACDLNTDSSWQGISLSRGMQWYAMHHARLPKQA
jgi:hypothetical protein